MRSQVKPVPRQAKPSGMLIEDHLRGDSQNRGWRPGPAMRNYAHDNHTEVSRLVTARTAGCCGLSGGAIPRPQPSEHGERGTGAAWRPCGTRLMEMLADRAQAIRWPSFLRRFARLVPCPNCCTNPNARLPAIWSSSWPGSSAPADGPGHAGRLVASCRPRVISPVGWIWPTGLATASRIGG